MTSKESDTGVVDLQREIVESESELKEEVHRLKHQMTEMYQAWIRGHPPPSFPANYTENPVFIPPLTQAQNPTTVDLSPQHVPVTDPYSYTPHFEPPVETEKPSRNVEQDEIFRKVKSLEQYLKNMQGIGSQMPKFDLYYGHGDPVTHLRGFCSKMRGASGKDELLMAYFSQSLSGAALELYTRQDASRWYTWDDLAQAFARHFQYNIDIILDRLSLTKVEKKPCESFREYGFRWREQAARVNPPMEEDEMVEYFLQALEPTYFGHLILAIGKSFNDVAIQSGTGSLLGKKKKDDVAMFVSRSGRGLRGSPHQYTQPRPQPQAYTQAPYNPSQHYFPPQDPQYSVRPSQYHVHHAQSYARPSPYLQWRSPTPQNPYPPPQPYRNPTGPSFRSRPDYRKERQQQKETFTPLGESYTNLFQRLRQLDVLRPIEPKTPNPSPRNLDYSLRCTYCSDAPRHDTEKCWHLKRAIQELIDTNQIVVQSPKAPNINQNPLPAHVETHMIEIIHKDGEPKNSSKSVMMIRASESNPFKAPDFAKAMPLTVKGVSEKLSTLDVKPSVLVVKGPSIDVEANQEKKKVIVLGVPGKPVIIVEGARITPVIIKPVTQLPMVDTKAVPWNYKQVIVTYKGKEVEEEVNETRGLTRSGRCFTPEELRKAKPFKDGHIPVKKSVTEEEAEEFLKRMKMQDYYIVEQLRKTPTQISLLSLLIHSDKHRKALMKILNETHIPDKITVNHLEKIANKIFKANMITFSDDELPMEGTEHNRDLYLIVKYEDSAVLRVLVDNHSSAIICPLSTLQKLKIGTKRIHMNNVCVRGFDGGGKASVGDIMLELSIGLVEFTMEFQVLDVVVSYNLLLGRPWIHAAKEIVVHGDENLSAYNDTIVPFIEVEVDKGPWVYQTFETVSVEKIPEGECIPGPKLPSVSVMVANEMLKNGFVPSKGLGSSLQGIAHPVCPRESFGTFGLGFTLTGKDMKKAKNLKIKAWSLPKHVPHISKSFVKPGVAKHPISAVTKPVVDFDEEMIKRFQSLFDEVNMVEIGEGSSNADVQLVGQIYFYVGFNDMTCMRNFQPNLKIQSNSETTIQEIECDDETEYDEEAAFQKISRELNHFEEKCKPNF
ncbi:uncharacterized protein [Nicotiana tomentosiformis]|uniref:uncharacterized protein n=1 Tax=Nicotiana tomentosiformis TaxID=4098 RepID=UPI00388CE2D4